MVKSTGCIPYFVNIVNSPNTVTAFRKEAARSDPNSETPRPVRINGARRNTTSSLISARTHLTKTGRSLWKATCFWMTWIRSLNGAVTGCEIRNLGTFLYTAISVATSRKGPWHLVHTLTTQTDMTNEWLKDQGLLSVKELWVNIHYPAMVR